MSVALENGFDHRPAVWAANNPHRAVVEQLHYEREKQRAVNEKLVSTLNRTHINEKRALAAEAKAEGLEWINLKLAEENERLEAAERAREAAEREARAVQAVAVVKTLGKMEDELLKEKPASGGRTVYVREAAPASDSPDSADERDEMIAQLRENVELERSSSAWAEDEFLPAMQAASTATVRALSVEKSQRDEIIARLRQELTSGRYGASGEEDLGWSDWIKSVAQRVGIDLDAASTRGSLTGAVASVRGSVSETLAAVEKALGDVDLSGLTAEETGANFSADVVRRAVEGQEPGDALAAEVAREKAAGQAAFQAFASSVARESAASAATEAAEAQAQAQAAKQRLDRKDFAFAASTTLTAAAKPGATVLQVTSQGGFAVGDTIRIGEGTSAETNIIAGFGSIHLAVPVSGSHPAGTVVVCVSAEADEDSAPVYRSAGLILDAESAAVAAAPAAAPASSAPPEKVPRAFDLPPPPTPAAPGTALALDGESGAAFAAMPFSFTAPHTGRPPP